MLCCWIMRRRRFAANMCLCGDNVVFPRRSNSTWLYRLRTICFCAGHRPCYGTKVSSNCRPFINTFVFSIKLRRSVTGSLAARDLRQVLSAMIHSEENHERNNQRKKANTKPDYLQCHKPPPNRFDMAHQAAAAAYIPHICYNYYYRTTHSSYI